MATSAAMLAASLRLPASAQTTPPTNLRVAATANDTYASAYFAQDMAFFTKAGLNVDLETMNNGAAIAAALSSGAMDVGIATPIILANAYLHGLPVVILAASALSRAGVPTTALCVAGASALKTPKDLEGKTLAVNALHSATEVNLDAWMAQGGADYSKLKMLELPFSAMGPSIQSGRIDGAVMTEPAMTVAMGTNNVKILVDLNDVVGSEYVSSCWFAMHDFAQKNSDVVRRFQSAIYAAQKWANGHVPESAAILAKYAKMDLDLVRRMHRSTFAESMKLADIQIYLDFASKYGLIARPVSAAALVFQA